VKIPLPLQEPVSWLSQYDLEPSLLPRRGGGVMVPVVVLSTKESLEAFVLTEESDINEVSEAITSTSKDSLFFVVPRQAVAKVCPEFMEGRDI
tara:strand:- start:604 stop:882 length:279 start_codon:yes stop_codon:yes gene_type:complete